MLFFLSRLVTVDELNVYPPSAKDTAIRGMLYKALLETSFEGASGLVTFDDIGDRLVTPFRIENQIDGVEVTIGGVYEGGAERQRDRKGRSFRNGSFV